MELVELYGLQNALDEAIAVNVREGYDLNSHYAESHLRYAFHTEVHELSNEVGFFKFWKNSHKVNRGDVLEELVDCLHLLLKIGLMKGYNRAIKSVEPYPLWEDVLVDEMFYELRRNELDSMGRYHIALMHLLGIAKKLDYTESEVIHAYKLKNMENHKRQERDY